MTRGAIRPTTRTESIQRALSMLSCVPDPPDPSVADAGGRPIEYRLEGGFNGGSDPYAPHCASWSFGGRTPTADCIGFVLWADGIDRKQPGYSGTVGPWLHCGSLLSDAQGAQRWCEPVANDAALAGDWLMTADHIAKIIRPAIYAGRERERDLVFDHLVIDCSPRHGRKTAIGLGGPWSDACQVVRYKLFSTTG